VVYVNLDKEYLNVATFDTPVLLLIKNWTFWYMEWEYILKLLYTGIINF